MNTTISQTENIDSFMQEYNQLISKINTMDDNAYAYEWYALRDRAILTGRVAIALMCQRNGDYYAGSIESLELDFSAYAHNDFTYPTEQNRQSA